MFSFAVSKSENIQKSHTGSAANDTKWDDSYVKYKSSSGGSGYVPLHMYFDVAPKLRNTDYFSLSGTQVSKSIENDQLVVIAVKNLTSITMKWTLNVPSSATISKPPASATVSFTVAPWGLYRSGQGKATYNGTTKTFTSSQTYSFTTAAATTVTLDNATVSSASYKYTASWTDPDETYESGGKLTFGTKGTIKITTTGSGTLKCTAGVTGTPSYTSSPATIDSSKLSSTSLTYTIDKGMKYSNATLTYSNTAEKTSGSLKHVKNFDITVKNTGGTNAASTTATETEGTITYFSDTTFLKKTKIKITTIGSGTLKFTSGVSGTPIEYTGAQTIERGIKVDGNIAKIYVIWWTYSIFNTA